MHRGNDVEEQREDARQAKDEVDKAVGDGEEGLAADFLVDGVAKVDDRAERGAEDRTDDGEEPIADHGLADGVCAQRGGGVSGSVGPSGVRDGPGEGLEGSTNRGVRSMRLTGIASVPGASQCHDSGGACADGDRENVAKVLADFIEALEEGAADPEAGTLVLELVVLGGGGGQAVGVACDDSGDDPVQHLGHLEASDGDGALREVAQEDGEQRDEAGDGRPEAGRDGVDAEPRDPKSSDGHGEGMNRHGLENCVADPRDTEEDADGNVHEAHDKVGRAPDLPRLLHRPRRDGDGKHDVEERREHAHGVDAVWLGGEVAAELGLHARCLVSVVQVADEERDAQRGDDARVDEVLGHGDLAISPSSTDHDCTAARDDPWVVSAMV